jgi:hypothetical protein
MRRLSLLLIAGLALLPLTLSGCSASKPTRFYVLSEMPDVTTSTSATQSTSTGRGPAIGVGPITLPKYLDRPQIVTHLNTNSLAQADLDQWGGDLDDNITRVLAANLAKLRNTDRVSIYPWKDGVPVDYQVTLNIARFERDISGSVVLDVFWTVSNPLDATTMKMRHSVYRDDGAKSAIIGIDGATDSPAPFEAVAAAMSRDLEALSRDIAKTIGAP